MVTTPDIRVYAPGVVNRLAKADGTQLPMVDRVPLAAAQPLVPINTVAPTITGTAAIASLMSGTNGTWSRSPTSYSVLWRYGDTLGLIPGATGFSYTVQSTDVGHTLQRGVRASNANGPAFDYVWSAPSAVIPAANTTASYQIAYLGSLPEGDTGQTSVLVRVDRTGDTSHAGSVDWVRTGTADASDFLPGTPTSGTLSFLAGETFKTFTQTFNGDTTIEPDDTAIYTISNPIGPAGVTSVVIIASSTLTITNDDAPPAVSVNTALPYVSGTPQVGQPLNTGSGLWTGNPTGFSYQWQWADTGADIPGATSGDYTPQASDMGRPLRSKVIATNAGGQSAPAYSNPTTAIIGTVSVSVSMAVNKSGPSYIFTFVRGGDTSVASTANWAVAPSSLPNRLPALPSDFGGTFPIGSILFAAGETVKTVAITPATYAQPE